MTARYGIISSSELFKSNRMDAGFHLTKKSLDEDGSTERARQAAESLLAADIGTQASPGALLVAMPTKQASKLIHEVVGEDAAAKQRLDAFLRTLQPTEALGSYFGDERMEGRDFGRGKLMTQTNPGTGTKTGSLTAAIGILLQAPMSEVPRGLDVLMDATELRAAFWGKISSDADLREQATQAKAYELLMALDPAVRKNAVKDLVRGSGSDFPRQIEAAIREYPFMALALAFRDEEADLVLQRQAEEAMAKFNKIAGLGRMIRPKP